MQDSAASNTTKVSSSTDVSLVSDLLDKVTCDDEGKCADPANSRFTCQLDEDTGRVVCGVDLHFSKNNTTTASSKVKV